MLYMLLLAEIFSVLKVDSGFPYNDYTESFNILTFECCMYLLSKRSKIAEPPFLSPFTLYLIPIINVQAVSAMK